MCQIELNIGLALMYGLGFCLRAIFHIYIHVSPWYHTDESHYFSSYVFSSIHKIIKQKRAVKYQLLEENRLVNCVCVYVSAIIFFLAKGAILFLINRQLILWRAEKIKMIGYLVRKKLPKCYACLTCRKYYGPASILDCRTNLNSRSIK